ncbi:hypothetical protein PISMIDRAFT_17688 [Pisolithus microcarpus 441]|uniref:Uncharacterized protein n=1 Tax=Pisolithus microcarpus 441 TaxID=765257 RepID=A0A0C9XN66_9AGAM|nr:hypothetical protein PISMIDRAFT_17688 [Pisolithus microcarpus 441]
MDYIDDAFMTGILDQQCLDPVICVALMLKKRTLNKYYSLTDVSKLYQIVMVREHIALSTMLKMLSQPDIGYLDF